MRLGNTDISSVKLGSSQVQAVYLGNNLVWQNAPTAIAATGVGTTSFTANWNAYSGAVYYLLDVSLNSSFSSYVLQDNVVYSTSYSVTGLASNTTYYYRVRASTEYDTDANAFFSRVTTAGGSLTTIEQQAVNSLVLDLKDYGIWTKMKAIYPMVGASAAACSQNLKSSSFTGTFTSGWTFASTGITPNGTSAYMDSGVNDLNDLGTTPTLSIYLNSIGTAHQWQMGVFSSTTNLTGLSINNAGTGNNYTNIRTNLSINYNETFTGGLYTGTTDSSNNYVYKNDVLKTTIAKSSSGLNQNHYLGALNAGGAFVYSDYQIAFAILGDSNFDSTNMRDLYTAVQAFQTTLNRQVS